MTPKEWNEMSPESRESFLAGLSVDELKTAEKSEGEYCPPASPPNLVVTDSKEVGASEVPEDSEVSGLRIFLNAASVIVAACTLTPTGILYLFRAMDYFDGLFVALFWIVYFIAAMVGAFLPKSPGRNEVGMLVTLIVMAAPLLNIGGCSKMLDDI